MGVPGREKLLLSVGLRSSREIWEREVEGSGVPLDMQRQTSRKAKDRAHPSLINRPKVVIIQQVGSICKGTCPGEKGYSEVVSRWAVNRVKESTKQV